MEKDIVLNKIKNDQFLFYIAYSIYLAFAILSKTFFYTYYGDDIYRIIKLIYLFLLSINEIIEFNKKRKEYSFLSLAICLFIGAILAYNEKILSDATLTIALIYCGRNASFKKIATLTIIESSILLLVVICSSYLGIIDNYIFDNGYRRREYLGFTYPLFSSAILSNITCLYIYLRSKCIQSKEIILLFLINFWLYLKTDARLSFYLTLFLLVLVFMNKSFKNNQICIKMKDFILCKLSIYLMWVLSVITFITSFFYDSTSEVWIKFNKILNSRLSLQNYSLKTYGITLFGDKTIPWVGMGLDSQGKLTSGVYLWVDNLYLFFIQRFGIVTFVVVLILLTIFLIKLSKKKEYLLLLLFSILAIRLCIDDLYLYLFYNTLWFLVPMVLQKDKQL